MAQILSVHQLGKTFSGRELFKGLAFGINDGDRIGLLGPNGAGKSTLMKILAQEMTPDTGNVVFRRGLRTAYMPQSPTFEPQDTIRSRLLQDYALDPDVLNRALEWIAKLELTQMDEESPIQSFSGGWQKRTALAEQLIKAPDVLLLDEPTNHLDVIGIKFLEDLLAQAPFATFFITHDRLFLQRVANKIFDLDPRFPGRVLTVDGSYDKYLEVKAQLISDQLVRETKLANTLRREKEWLARGAQARQTKQQARIEQAGELAADVENLRQLNRARGLDLDFGGGGQGPRKLIVAEQLGKKSYANPSEWLFRGINMVVTNKTRLALLGVNGSGKTTLIKTLLGTTQPDQGRVLTGGDKLKVAYFEQTRETLQLDKSVLKNICPEGDYVDFRGQHIHVRSYLDRFKFHVEKADLPVHRLSGGEQARLRIAQLMLKECQILVLDEPTNDLDLETLDVLQESLQEFDGAVILVTHDRFFMDQVCSHILAFDTLEAGNCVMFADYSQWEAWFEQKKSASRGKNAKADKGAAEKKKLSFKEKFEFENMETSIAEAEQKLVQIRADLEKPGIASDAAKVQELYEQLHKGQLALDGLFQRWSELGEKARS